MYMYIYIYIYMHKGKGKVVPYSSERRGQVCNATCCAGPRHYGVGWPVPFSAALPPSYC